MFVLAGWMFGENTHHARSRLCRRNVPVPRTSRCERAGSLICGCDLISANWLIGASDTEDTTMHADIHACAKGRRKRIRSGEKRTWWVLLRALQSLHVAFQENRSCLSSILSLFPFSFCCPFSFLLICFVLSFFVMSLNSFIWHLLLKFSVFVFPSYYRFIRLSVLFLHFVIIDVAICVSVLNFDCIVVD